MGRPLSSPPAAARPLSCLALLGLTLLALLPVFFMLGPAATIFAGMSQSPRPGWRYLVGIGIAGIVLHVAFFVFMLAMPTWYPQAYALLHPYFHSMAPPAGPGG
jgi:hypothetical protein